MYDSTPASMVIVQTQENCLIILSHTIETHLDSIEMTSRCASQINSQKESKSARGWIKIFMLSLSTASDVEVAVFLADLFSCVLEFVLMYCPKH